jgi:hypothetical protein
VAASFVLEHAATGELQTITVEGGTSVVASFARTAPAGPFEDRVLLTESSSSECGTVPASVSLAGNGITRGSSLSRSYVDLGTYYCGVSLPAPETVILRNHDAVPLPFTTRVGGTTGLTDILPASGTVPPLGEIELSLYVRPHLGHIGHERPVFMWVDAGTQSHAITGVVHLSGVSVHTNDVSLGETPVGTHGSWSSADIRPISIVDGRAYQDRISFRVSGPANELEFGRDWVGWDHYDLVPIRMSPASVGPRSFEITVEVAAGTPVCGVGDDRTLTVTGTGTGARGVNIWGLGRVETAGTVCGRVTSTAAFGLENYGDGAESFELTGAPSFVVAPRTGTVAPHASQIVNVALPTTARFDVGPDGFRAGTPYDANVEEGLEIRFGAVSETLPLSARVWGTAFTYEHEQVGDDLVVAVGMTQPGAYTFAHAASGSCALVSEGGTTDVSAYGFHCPTGGSVTFTPTTTADDNCSRLDPFTITATP